MPTKQRQSLAVGNGIIQPLKTSAELSQKRYVVAGSRAYVVGMQDGSFPPLGWHIRGEMGGVWAPPLKLLDGLTVELQGRPLPPAGRFYRYPETVAFDYEIPLLNLTIRRTDVVPEGIPGVIFRWHVQNNGDQAQAVHLAFRICIHPLLAHPWGRTEIESQMHDPAFRFQTDLQIRDEHTCLARVASLNRYVAVWLSPAPTRFSTQPVETYAPMSRLHNIPEAVSVGLYELTCTVPAHSHCTVSLAAAGSLTGEAEAFEALSQLTGKMQQWIGARQADYQNALDHSHLSTPNDLINRAFYWSKANLRMSALEAPGIGRGIAAGYPDYPWWFANDGCYAIPALLTVGQFDLARDHLYLIARKSEEANHGSGKIIHELVTDGTVTFGLNADPGNTSETALFAIAVYLTWLWSGDDDFLQALYPLVRKGLLKWLAGTQMDSSGLPLGYGNDEEPGWGPWRLDVACYSVKAFEALVHMAQYLNDRAAASEAGMRANLTKKSIDRYFWVEEQGLYAYSLSGDEKSPLPPFGSSVPMECSLAPLAKAMRCFSRLESPEFNTEWGFAHPEWLNTYPPMTIGTGILAVAEANYGRIDKSIEQVQKIARHIQVEFPGALPEFAPPYPDHEYPFWQPNLFQTWGAYGLHWPLIRSVFGLQPAAAEKLLTIVPHLPSSWPGCRLDRVEIGGHTINIAVNKDGPSYEVQVENCPQDFRLILGLVLPRRKAVKQAYLNHKPSPYQSRHQWGTSTVVYIELHPPNTQTMQWKVELES